MVRSQPGTWYVVSTTLVSPSFSESKGNDLAVVQPQKVFRQCESHFSPVSILASLHISSQCLLLITRSRAQAAHDSGRRKRKYTSGGFPQATISSVPHITHSCFPLLAVIVHYPFCCSFGCEGKLWSGVTVSQCQNLNFVFWKVSAQDQSYPFFIPASNGFHFLSPVSAQRWDVK